MNEIIRRLLRAGIVPCEELVYDERAQMAQVALVVHRNAYDAARVADEAVLVGVGAMRRQWRERD